MSTNVKKNQQLPTISNDVEELNEQQVLAIRLMLQGWKQNEVAQELGIAAETISRWKREAEFVAALNAGKTDMYDATVQRLRDMTDRALDVLDNALDCGHRPTEIGAAKTVLSFATKFAEPNGTTNIEALRLALRSEEPSELDKLLAEMSHG